MKHGNSLFSKARLGTTRGYYRNTKRGKSPLNVTLFIDRYARLFAVLPLVKYEWRHLLYCTQPASNFAHDDGVLVSSQTPSYFYTCTCIMTSSSHRPIHTWTSAHVHTIFLFCCNTSFSLIFLNFEDSVQKDIQIKAKWASINTDCALWLIFSSVITQ